MKVDHFFSLSRLKPGQAKEIEVAVAEIAGVRTVKVQDQNSAAPTLLIEGGHGNDTLRLVTIAIGHLHVMAVPK
jgi:hypothetical protein